MTSDAWNGGSQGGDWSADNHLYNSLRLSARADNALGGECDWGSTVCTWHSSGDGGDWGVDNDFWYSDWSSAGGDDSLGGDGDWTST
ncbi:unnamed protein product [[Candida] boidinii]|uniref:Unnamed protein product n=1 Tax=Candida boidinii TaxID=5477 RepID=A0ACB5TTH9_CANBO|nr:unnamed protein product [[Candida] boidinii]